MSSDSGISRSLVWDWPSWMKGSVPNPLDVFAVPQSFTQPILPGWVFGNVTNVTETNSSAPDTERDIVAAHSYGSQLGRVVDALAALIAELPPAQQDAKAFQELMKLSRDIGDIKVRAAARRLDRVVSDLATLKKASPDDYERVAAKLRDAVDGA